MSPTENLKILQQANTFVLFIPEVDMVSYSMIQLGAAMMCCKHTLIVYKNGTVTPRVEGLDDSLGLQRISFNDLEQDFEKTCGRLMGRIEEYLDAS